MYRRIWLVTLLFATAAIAFGWWQGWNFSKTFTLIKNTGEEGQKRLESTAFVKDVKQQKKAVQNFLENAAEQQKKTALTSINKAKTSLIAGARRQTADVLSSLEKKLGLEKNSGQSNNLTAVASGNLTFITTVHVNETAYFMVKSDNDSFSRFVIEWGDGAQTTGSLAAGEEKLVSHRWQAVGDYEITFGEQKLLIRVIK